MNGAPIWCAVFCTGKWQEACLFDSCLVGVGRGTHFQSSCRVIAQDLNMVPADIVPAQYPKGEGEGARTSPRCSSGRSPPAFGKRFFGLN
jgi:hypothetical protein